MTGVDVEDEAVSAFVVVAPDQDEAIVPVSQIATSRGCPSARSASPGSISTARTASNGWRSTNGSWV
jgi:hypothetical protein